jgi:hypothetical protein
VAKGVRLKPLQTARDTVTPLDLRRFHEAVQAALDLLQGALLQRKEIAKGAVGEDALGEGSIYDKHVADGAGVKGSKLGAGSVNRDRIQPNTLTDSEIDPAANIVGTKLAPSSVNADRMNTVAGGSTGLTTAHVAPAAGLLGTQIANTTIDALNIKNNTITKNQILAKTLTHNELDDSAGILGTQLDAAAGIVDGQITSLNGSKLTANSVPSSKLEARLLQGFKSVQSVAAFKRGPNTAIPFATQSWGGAQWSTTSTISLGVATPMQINARVSFASDGASTVDLGAKAQLYLQDSAGTIVAAGEWAAATTDENNNVVLVATLRWAGSLAAGATKTYSLRFRGFMSNGSAPVTWVLQAESLGATPYEGGSYIEGIVIP